MRSRPPSSIHCQSRPPRDAAFLFPELSCLVSLVYSSERSFLLSNSYIFKVCLFFFFDQACAEQNFPHGRWRPYRLAMSMASIARLLSLFSTRFSCMFGMNRTKALTSPTVFERKMKCIWTLWLRASTTFSGFAFPSQSHRAHAAKSSLTQLDVILCRRESWCQGQCYEAAKWL